MQACCTLAIEEHSFKCNSSAYVRRQAAFQVAVIARLGSTPLTHCGHLIYKRWQALILHCRTAPAATPRWFGCNEAHLYKLLQCCRPTLSSLSLTWLMHAPLRKARPVGATTSKTSVIGLLHRRIKRLLICWLATVVNDLYCRTACRYSTLSVCVSVRPQFGYCNSRETNRELSSQHLLRLTWKGL